MLIVVKVMYVLVPAFKVVIDANLHPVSSVFFAFSVRFVCCYVK